MTRTVNDYQILLQQLLPPGPLWESLCQPGTQFNQLLLALADEFANIDGRAQNLLDEINPLTSTELLDEWEAFAGLPECGATGQTDNQRRNAIRTKLQLVGDNRIDYFIEVAAALGYTITITPLGAYAYQVNAPATTIIESTCLSPCTEPLRVWGNEQLECALNKVNPAHLNQSFSYGA